MTAPNSAHAGFRLRAVELRNWGTFDGDCHYVMDLGCASACLTGLNGSGKSTIVDALLTLLVPHDLRSYNVAATGTGAKRERTLKTYILGAYGKEESPESSRGQPKFLRRPGTPSILLAVFHDAVFNKSVTLAQLHWITVSGEHQARYLCREGECRIGDLGLGSLGVPAFKDHFEKNGWNYETTFDPYEGRFMNLLRIPSRQALKLLCRTVSVKDVPSVTEFIRSLMLEPYPAAENLAAIEKHFNDLDRIHTQLEETKQEIDLLKPVAEHHAAYQKAADEAARLKQIRRAAEVILARDAGLLLDAEVGVLGQRQTEQEAQAKRLKGDLAVIDQRILEINLSMKQSSSAKAIEQLRKEEEALKEELARVRAQRADLQQWLVALGRPGGLPGEAGLAELKAWAATELTASDEKKNRSLKESGVKDAQALATRATASALSDEINEMDGRPDKIPRHFRDMRRQICTDLQLDEAALPFAGELIDVPPAEKPWRESLEVLLHGFALSILVPPEHYQRFSAYVDRSQFRRRLVYYAATKGTGANVTLSSDRAYGKLILRSDAWCRGWLQEHVLASFPHRCAATMEEFWAERGPAMTRNRHLKGGQRHSKEGTDSERDYDLLGWSNKDKLEELRAKLLKLHAAARTLDDEAKALDRLAKSLTAGITLLGKLGAIASYRAIDEAGVSAELTTATDRRQELEDTDEIWKTLQSSLDEANGEKSGVEVQYANALSAAAAHETTIKALRGRRAEHGTRFNAAALEDFDWKTREPEVDYFREGDPLALKSHERQIQAVLQRIDAKLSTEEKAATKAERLLLPAMGTFLDATRKKGYNHNWSATAASAPGLVAHMARLIGENFHTQQKEFQTMMRRVLLVELKVGDGDQNVKIRANRERIAELNQTLLDVPYNDDTRVQIVARPSRENAVLTYRAKLEECTKHTVGMKDEQLLDRFGAVKALVTYIREKRSEAERGANPNNWDIFAIEESHPGVDEKPVNWYSDADGNSGGQKAKLACTIVAAAMAFQLKHTRTKQSNAFRLVMVDEIFSKSDDVNSAYALAIFEKFDFQLLLVTPRDGRLKLVQPFVGSFHLVQNPTTMASAITSMHRTEIEAAGRELLEENARA